MTSVIPPVTSGKRNIFYFFDYHNIQGFFMIFQYKVGTQVDIRRSLSFITTSVLIFEQDVVYFMCGHHNMWGRRGPHNSIAVVWKILRRHL